ncbi:HdeD family acid-resistance protein [Mycobacterium koreense]|uniref:Uncharacterized protein n=1 Tax=Mycolicibacillus koreensis TaxID=1069220 RepID=A0A7I7S8J6_9MYCO|nr:HdeD family acid-resistance protein [Mycolicibacillus koreensis]MCV7249283.1 HdeD family acid-resistance protein [Mycolicibacillus koreensis]ODR10212.1 hypothetical protein BHQ15_05195 [Mycolicibacillus koreensis]OSC35568.1 hypothetical protein B8W67_02270 [Mycolicibacillus koreensis]BBY53194.1 hypothetical protein MKOR_04450 [Mycolicibacillus koreensis]
MNVALTSKTRAPGAVAQALWRTALVWGIAALVLGGITVVWPTKSITVAAVLFGVYLLVSGVVSIVAAFGIGESVGTRAMLFISGALSVVLGVLTFRDFDDGSGVLFLAIWIGVGFIFQGVAEVGVAVDHPEVPGRGWQITTGVVTVLGGLILLAYPFSSIVILAIVAGAWLVAIGVLQIGKALRLRSAVNAL